MHKIDSQPRPVCPKMLGAVDLALDPFGQMPNGNEELIQIFECALCGRLQPYRNLSEEVLVNCDCVRILEL